MIDNTQENQQPAMAADITIIIVNWNSGDNLSKCLIAVAAQTVLPGKVIIVDNHSEDDSLQNALPHFPNTEVIRLDHNAGFARGNNIGISHTETRFIVLLNPDAFPNANWLEQLLLALNAKGENASYASQLLDANSPDIVDGSGDVYHVSGLAWRRDHGRPVSQQTANQPLFSPCAAAALYSVAAVRHVGGFDEDYFCYFEDVDLGFRLRLAGYDCHYVPKAVVRHVGSASTGRRSEFSLYHGHRNLVWTFIKNMPTRLFAKYILLHLLLNIFSIFYFACKGEALPVIKGKIAAIGGLRSMWAKRAQTQSLRTVDNEYLRKAMYGALIFRSVNKATSIDTNG